MAVTLAEISKLRKMTGAGMMDCKSALTEAENDFEKAVEIIRKKGKAIAAKRSEREASEGCVLAKANGQFAAVLALKCETDFVAKNEDFIGLTKMILDKAIELQPENLDALKAIEIDGRSIENLITDRSGVTGEKMELDYYEYVKGETTIAYIHPGNKLASIVSFGTTAEETVAKNVAMQVAAMNPIALDRASVPADIVAKELELGKEKAREEGKPENILDKIAEGRLNKFFQDTTLLEQTFIVDNKINVQQYVKDNNTVVSGFKRVTLNQE